MLKNLTNRSAFSINPIIVSELKGEWQRTMAKYRADEAEIEESWQILVEKYSEKHRAYHNLSHIDYLLKEARRIEFEDSEAIYFAVWFHDAIYQPKRGDNEIESANLAVKMLSNLNVPPSRISKIEQIILATQTHSAENLDGDGQIFLDLDLSILGADEKVYQIYSRAIRREYSHVEDSLYRSGRTQVLENFLRRSRIYFTENLHERFEAQARLNLADEIKQLSEQ